MLHIEHFLIDVEIETKNFLILFSMLRGREGGVVGLGSW
jgi:hypothetical protein